jgi:hypothetical protein
MRAASILATLIYSPNQNTEFFITSDYKPTPPQSNFDDPALLP